MAKVVTLIEKLEIQRFKRDSKITIMAMTTTQSTTKLENKIKIRVEIINNTRKGGTSRAMCELDTIHIMISTNKEVA